MFLKKLAPTLACLAVLALVFAARGSGAQQAEPEFRVIVNPHNPVQSLSRSDVSKLMLRQLPRWQDGTEAQPVDLPESSPIRDAFNREIHGRKSQAIASYWQRQIFSANQVPPPTLASDDEVVAYVREQPGAIGYVSASAQLGGVREVEILDR